MLDSMRKFSTNIFSKLLLGLLVIAFGIWGVGDIMHQGGPTEAARVGSETISTAEFKRQASLVKRQLESLGITGMNDQTLATQVIRQLVQQKLILMAMHDAGLFVNDTLAAKALVTMPEFQGSDGKFSATQFSAVLGRERIAEATYVKQLKKDIAGKFMTDTLRMDDAKLPPYLLRMEASIRGETRDAVIFTVPARSVETPSETEIKEFYEANKNERFRKPETRDLEYVIIAPTQLEALVNQRISPEMLKEAAASKPELSENARKDHVRRGLREQTIRDISSTVEDELAAGRTLAQAFTKAGITSDLRKLTAVTSNQAKNAGDVESAVITQGFQLSEGEISSLLTSTKGSLLMVSAKKIQPSQPEAYVVVASEAKTLLEKQKAKEASISTARKVKEALAKEPNWQAVAEKFQLTARVLSTVPRPNPQKPEPYNSVPYAMHEALFERGIGQAVGPLSLPNGEQLVGLVTDTHAPVLAPTTTFASETAAALQTHLTSAVDAEAYLSFTRAHTVVVNPGILTQTAQTP